MEEGKYNRDINCLRDRDKNVRLGALNRLLSCVDIEHDKVNMFFRLKIHLIELLNDPTDKCKELCAQLLKAFVLYNSIPPEDLSLVIKGFHSRIGLDPALETCEEIRVSLINILFDICKVYRECIYIEIQRITDIVARSCKDKCPAIKITSGDIIIYLCETDKKIGLYWKKIFDCIKPNIYHQQYKVRINSLQAIGKLTQCESAYQLSLELYTDFKKVLLDRRPEVHMILYEIIHDILLKLPETYLQDVEGKLCYLLLFEESDDLKRLENLFQHKVLTEDPEHTGARHIIMKNLKEITNLCLCDLQEWTIQDNYRTKASHALYQIIETCHEYILTHIEQILKVLFRTYTYEPSEILTKIIKSIGRYCEFELLMNIFTIYCTSVNFIQDINSALKLLILMIVPLSPPSIQISPILNLISSLVTSEEVLILRSIHELLYTLLQKFQASFPIDRIFSCVLALDSSSISDEVQATIGLLASYAAVTVQELYSKYLYALMPGFLKNYKNWTSDCLELKTFVKIVCRAQITSKEAIEIVFFSCRADSNEKIKLLMLDIVDIYITDIDLSTAIIQNIIIPTAAWRQFSHLVRIKSIKILNKMIKSNAIDKSVIIYHWEKLFPVLRTCINDENSELRQESLITINLLLESYNTVMEEREILDIYPELLKRLDDSLNIIRISATVPFILYFQVLKMKKMKFGNYNYVVGNLFTQLDDPSEAIQKAMTSVLEAAAAFNPESFLELGKEAMQKHKHPRCITELVESTKTLLQ
jgi:hypothetical protein